MSKKYSEICAKKRPCSAAGSSSRLRGQSGFTIIELVMVIVILGILAAFALPKFSDLSGTARVATLEGIQGAMRSTISIVRSKAYVNGLSVTTANPGNQSAYIVETEAGRSEVDWRNLCPESRAELADALSMADHIGLSESGGLTTLIDNRYTRIGYDIRGTGAPTANGCYVTYDSFGDPECTVAVVKADC
jgi:MSHA pilin protein MshA